MIAPSEVTPPRHHDVVQQITRHIKGDAFPAEVKRASRLRPLGNCYWNVASVIKESGGDLVLGWAILWWPQMYVVGVHHAVWPTPDGQLWDVTEPQRFDKRSGHTLFLPDDSRKITLDIIPCIDNQFVNISGTAVVDAYISAYITKESVRRRLTEINWISGYRCEGNFAIATGGKSIAAEKILVVQSAVPEYRALSQTFNTFNRHFGEAIESVRRAAAGG
jgi:hypothetical protein